MLSSILNSFVALLYAILFFGVFFKFFLVDKTKRNYYIFLLKIHSHIFQYFCIMDFVFVTKFVVVH